MEHPLPPAAREACAAVRSGSSCRTRSTANTPTPDVSGLGSGSFPATRTYVKPVTRQVLSPADRLGLTRPTPPDASPRCSTAATRTVKTANPRPEGELPR